MFRLHSAHVAVLLALALCGSTCRGALVSINDSTFGTNSFTRDTATGLEWLDISFSDGKSFQSVSSQLVSGGTFAGLRHATAAELDQFMRNAGINPQAQIALFNYTPVQNFEALVGGPTGTISLGGMGISLGSYTVTHGITADVSGAGSHNYGGVQWTTSTLLGGPSGAAFSTYGSQSDSTANNNRGHWLVRVPEPTGSLLAVLGLAALASRRKGS